MSAPISLAFESAQLLLTGKISPWQQVLMLEGMIIIDSCNMLYYIQTINQAHGSMYFNMSPRLNVRRFHFLTLIVMHNRNQFHRTASRLSDIT